MRRALILSLFATAALGADDTPDVVAQDRRAGKDANNRYYLLSRKGEKVPKAGLGLVLILPGGDGSADFHPFVKRLFDNAVPKGYVAAQLVAPKWEDKQAIVWPTRPDKVKEAKFTTEAFVADVIAEVSKKHAIDPKRVFTLSWSSGGPAAYQVALADSKVKGSLVAMSVFRKNDLAPLKRAKGHAFYLYHSPDDRTCPMWMARLAVKELTAEGAKVELATYKGGHGWRGPVYADVKKGIEWLEKQTAGKKKE